jgi:hypothetical protein
MVVCSTLVADIWPRWGELAVSADVTEHQREDVINTKVYITVPCN